MFLRNSMMKLCKTDMLKLCMFVSRKLQEQLHTYDLTYFSENTIFRVTGLWKCCETMAYNTFIGKREPSQCVHHNLCTGKKANKILFQMPFLKNH